MVRYDMSVQPHSLRSASGSERRKTSLNLAPTATKALARAKFELSYRHDINVSQSDILEALLLKYGRDIDLLQKLLSGTKTARP
jgi:hypothetical protein